MRPASIYGLRPRNTAIAALCLLLAGCGQTGALYLPRTKAPQVTTHVAPAAATATPTPSPATHGQS